MVSTNYLNFSRDRRESEYKQTYAIHNDFTFISHISTMIWIDCKIKRDDEKFFYIIIQDYT